MDGATSQYKNFKSLINLMYHEHDFNLKEAEHHFLSLQVHMGRAHVIGLMGL